jgi:hypothetical protein
LSDADNETTEAFYRLVSALSVITFGDFDFISEYFGNNTEDAERLKGLNVTFLMLEVWKKRKNYHFKDFFQTGHEKMKAT